VKEKIMPEEPSTHSSDANLLVKKVPGHLFKFEEKIFGMSLQHLLTDIGVFTGCFSLTGSLHLLTRLIVCALVTLLAMLFVHGKVQGRSLSSWCYLLIRSHMIPTPTIWRPAHAAPADPKHKELPSIQDAWIPIDTLHHGIAGKSDHHKKTVVMRFWMIFEIEGKNIHLFPEHEQARIFHRFESFLTGLEFHVQFLSQTEQIDPLTAEPLRMQKEALATLTATPHLHALQQASLAAQERQMTACTRTRHFLIVSASSSDAIFQNPEGTARSVLSALVHLLSFKKTPVITQAQVLDQLHVRASVVRSAMQHLDLRIWPLQDHDVLQLFARCLTPGSVEPTFLPERLAEQAATIPATRSYRKRLQGTHGMFHYTSSHAQACFEPEPFTVADLLAPSRIDVQPDVMIIRAGNQTRYTRTFTVTGYGYHLLCGWVNQLHDLGLPLLVSSHLDPVENRFMILKLEQALTKLESKRLADQKTLRITKADQSIEAEQIRQVIHALASKKLKIFEVSLTMTVHAGSLERLEQRSRYLSSHLRDRQLQAHSALRQQDLAWQSSLPVGRDLLQNWVKLTSDVVSTMLPGTSGVIGTPTGIFLGYTGSDQSRRPVYLHLWHLPNPHVVVIGETGQGKSWLGKTMVMGLMGLGMADVCVLDKDNDYLALHEELPGESQRYNLARNCPINPFDIPFGPEDVNPDDPADLLAEFFDNALMTALALLVTDEETKLTKGEEAYLMSVARATYADEGITSEKIRQFPDTLLLPAPTLADFTVKMRTLPASSESMRQSLLERLEKASYLFHGSTSVSLEKPLTIFSINELDEKWFALMTYVVQNFLMRHRALKQDDRYLAYIVEEASYLLRNAAGRRYLERGSRGFRKLGIAQITLSQHPRDFLEAGQVVLSNAGTVFYLGMERNAVEQLHLAEELERVLIEGIPGQCVVRIGNEYAPLTIWSNPVYRAIFTTDPAERRALRKHQRQSKQTEQGAYV
jgi:Helicase HerA, central domain